MKVDPAGNRTETYYKQDAVMAGLVEKVISRDSAGNIYSYVYNTYEDHLAIEPQYTDHYGYAQYQIRPLSGPRLYVHSPLLIQQDTYLCDGSTQEDLGTRPGGSSWKHLLVEYKAYDSYGKPYQVVEWGEVDENGNDVGADRRETTITYARNESTWVNVPALKKILGTDGFSNVLQSDLAVTERYYYDGDDCWGCFDAQGTVSHGRLKAIEQGGGYSYEVVEEYGYDAYGNVTQVRDANGNISTIQYDDIFHTLVVRTEDPNGNGINNEYDILNRLNKTWRDDFGVRTEIAYDVFGRPIQRDVLERGNNTLRARKQMFYAFDGISPEHVHVDEICQQGDVYTRSSRVFLDGFGQEIQRKESAMPNGSAASNRTTTRNQWVYSQDDVNYHDVQVPYESFGWEYDASRPVIPVSAVVELTRTEREYAPSVGVVTTTTYPDGSEEIIEQRPLKRVSIDPMGYKAASFADGLGNAVEQWYYEGVGAGQQVFCKNRTVFETAGGKVIQTIDDVEGQAVTKHFEYDKLQRLILQEDDDRGVWTFDYDGNGNVVSQTDAKGQATTWTYDVLDRVTAQQNQDGTGITYTYDSDQLGLGNDNYCLGRLTMVEDESGWTKFAYDLQGKVSEEHKMIHGAPGVAMTRYDYTGLGQLLAVTYPDGETVEYDYESPGALTSLSGANTYVQDIHYDIFGSETGRYLGNGVFESCEYGAKDLNYQLEIMGVIDGNGQPIYGNCFAYDQAGNIAAISDTVEGHARTFDYDHLHRLTAQTDQNFVGGAISYAYDPVDNIVSRMVGSKIVEYDYDGDKPHAVRRTSDGVAYMYDANGNMISRINSSDYTINSGNAKMDYAIVSAGSIDDDVGGNTFVLGKLDANNDGIVDVLLGNQFQNYELHLGNGDGTFTMAQNSGLDVSAGQPSVICIFDADNDGDEDIATGQYTELNKFFINHGDGTFTQQDAGDYDNIGYHTMSVVAADINADGYIDLIEGTYFGDYVYINDGNGVFTRIDAGDFDDDNKPMFDLAAADMDGDGDIDLITGLEGEVPRLYSNNGVGQFTRMDVFDPGNAAVTTWKAEALIVMDVNGDEYLDVVVGNYGFENRIFYGNEFGTYAFTPLEGGVSAPGYNSAIHSFLGYDALLTRDMAAEDLDCDGDLDIVVTNYATPRRVYRNMGSGVFEKVDIPALEADSRLTFAVLTLDANSDGYADLVFGNHQSSNQVFLLDGELSAIPVAASIKIRAAGSHADGWPEMELYADDKLLDSWTVNHMDYRDYTYNASLEDLTDVGRFYVRFLNDRWINEHFEWGGQWATRQGGFWDSQNWLSGDFNGDGKDDLMNVWNDGGAATMSGHLSDGSSISGQRFATRQGGIWNSMNWFAGDFNGDGKNDIGKVWNEGGKSTIDIHISSGNAFTMERWVTQVGNFTDHQQWVVGDFSGDGKTDLARVYGVASTGGMTLHTEVYKSTGTTFVHETWPCQYGSTGYTDAQNWMSGDYDGDGKDDLIYTYRFNDTKSAAYIRRSSGSDFNSGHNRPYLCFWSESGMKWSMGDVNGDHLADLILVWDENNQANLSVFFSTPNGLLSGNGFDDGHRWATGQDCYVETQKWRAGDYNGDGRMDVCNVFNDSGNASMNMHASMPVQDRNLFVDYIELNGVKVQSEDSRVDYIRGGSLNSSDIIPGQEVMAWTGWLNFPKPTALAGSWNFNEGSGVTAGEVGGSNGSLTLHGATWVQGKNGYALYFDGIDDYATIDNISGLPSGNDPYTIEAWIKPDSMGARGIVGWGQYYAVNKVNCLRLSGSGLINYWWANDLIVTTGSLVGDWHHVVATFDGATRAIYVDGNLVVSDTPSGHDVPFENFTVGRTLGNEYFHGAIDELTIMKRAMTADEVAYKSANPPEDWQFIYDTQNQLAKIAGPVSAQYVYDYTGTRVKKVEDGEVSYYFNPYYELENGAAVKYYYANGSLVAYDKTGTLTYVHQDYLGSTARITDDNGLEIKSIVYMPYGNDADIAGVGDDPKYRYTGQEQDKTGLYYYGARFYDPDLGRFLSVDPLGDDYCYANNNPVMFNDPTGLTSEPLGPDSAWRTLDIPIGPINSSDNDGTADGSPNLHFGDYSDLVMGTTASYYDMANKFLGYSQPFSGLNALGELDALAADTFGRNNVDAAYFATMAIAPEVMAPAYAAFSIMRIQTAQLGLLRSMSMWGRMPSIEVRAASKSTVKFGQSSVKPTFAHGPFKGQSIADVVKGLRSGKISPDQLPVEYIVRNGEKVALNNRSLTTLRRAGMDPTKLIDRTGIARYEKLLDSHLAGGSASDVIRIRGGAPGTSLIE